MAGIEPAVLLDLTPNPLAPALAREDAAEARVVRRAPERERPDQDMARPRDGARPDEEEEHLGAEQREVQQVEVQLWEVAVEEGQRVVLRRRFENCPSSH